MSDFITRLTEALSEAFQTSPKSVVGYETVEWKNLSSDFSLPFDFRIIQLGDQGFVKVPSEKNSRWHRSSFKEERP